MKRIFSLLVVTITLNISCFGISVKDNNARDYPHYEIYLKLNPENQEINVLGKLFINNLNDSLNDFSFYLHRGMKIESLSINQMNYFKTDTNKSDNQFMPQALKFVLNKNALDNNQKDIEIDFSYGGKLTALPKYFANIISSDWTEIGMYYPWFPYTPDYKLFTYNLSIDIDSTYIVTAMGKIEKKEGQWIIRNNTPTNDIVICAAKDTKCSKTYIEQNTLSIFYSNLSDSLVNKMQNELYGIIQKYNSWFGKKEQDLIVVQSKREKGGGYARIGGVFLGGFNSEKYYSNNEGYHRYFAHEFGHLWWYKAQSNTWEDWLNEGLAEYSALMIIRERFGEEAFIKRIEKKRENLKGTTPIWGFDRNNTKTEEGAKNVNEVLYNKGPVLFFELEKDIGKKRFIEFCSLLIEKDINSTFGFLETLRLVEGEKVSDWFQEMLKTR